MKFEILAGGLMRLEVGPTVLEALQLLRWWVCAVYEVLYLV